MKVFVNEREREVAEETTLAALLDSLGHAGRKGLAVAINDEVAPRSSWTLRGLSDGDRILVIQATQGG